MFFKKKNSDISKKYISINNNRYDNDDILKQKKLYDIMKKYVGYDTRINLEDKKQINDIVCNMFSDLFDIKILCNNYKDFINDCNNITLDDINNFDLLNCLACLTMIQRVDYRTGGYGNVYPEYTENKIIPTIIDRIINIFEEKFYGN